MPGVPAPRHAVLQRLSLDQRSLATTSRKLRQAAQQRQRLERVPSDHTTTRQGRRPRVPTCRTFFVAVHGDAVRHGVNHDVGAGDHAGVEHGLGPVAYLVRHDGKIGQGVATLTRCTSCLRVHGCGLGRGKRTRPAKGLVGTLAEVSGRAHVLQSLQLTLAPGARMLVETVGIRAPHGVRSSQHVGM